MSFHRILEMTIGADEFFRLLRTVVPGAQVDGETARWSEAGHAGTIRLISLPDRRVGSVTLSRQRVEIDLHGCTEPEGEAFLARFRRAFIRAGG